MATVMDAVRGYAELWKKSVMCDCLSSPCANTISSSKHLPKSCPPSFQLLHHITWILLTHAGNYDTKFKYKINEVEIKSKETKKQCIYVCLYLCIIISILDVYICLHVCKYMYVSMLLEI